MLQRYKYEAVVVAFKWIRLFLSYLLFCSMLVCAANFETVIYLIHQAKGQISILLNTQSFKSYTRLHTLTSTEKNNLLLIEKVKTYSIDSLNYLPTKNFTTVYDQKTSAVLFVVTASEPFELKAYEWNFPVVGRVSYKGFFKRELALKEYNRLISLGYDVDLRSVSAWSTLGWFQDPLLSSMLKYSKGSFCNLLFHELFHSSYYAANAVNFNENIASFIAHKATIQFLNNDTLALNDYLKNMNDNSIYTKYMISKANFLRSYYPTIKNKSNSHLLKLKVLYQIADSIRYLPLSNKNVFVSKKEAIMKNKNAFFVDFEQYDSMQDSLNLIFNNIYKGNLKKLVQDLRQGKTIVKFDK